MPGMAANGPTIPNFPPPPHHDPMAVIEEDGGKLNAFAKEPRMQLVEGGEGLNRSSLVLVAAGGLLVALMVALAFRVS